MAYLLKNQFALKASNEYILIDYISKKGFYDQTVRVFVCCKFKVKGNLFFNLEQPPQEYHLRINGKIVPYNEVDKILDRNAGEISDFALIFANTIGLKPGEKSKFTFTGKGAKLMGKLVVQPLEETITIPSSSEIGEDVHVGETAEVGLVNQPPPPISLDIRENNMKILKEAYKNYLDGKYPFEKIKSEANIEEAYNNKKIFVIKKQLTGDVIVVGQEGLYYIQKGEEYYFPWPEIKNITMSRLLHGRKRRIVVNLIFWNEEYFRFIPGKYDQSEFPTKITGNLKGPKVFQTLFRKYWKPDFSFKDSILRF